MRRAILSAVFLLVLAPPAPAQVPTALSGFELDVSQLDCPAGFTSTSSQTSFDATNVRSGARSLLLKHDAGGSTRGLCGSFADQALTGTIYLTFAVRPELSGAIYCTPGLDAPLMAIRNSSGSTVVGMHFRCTNLQTDYRLMLVANGSTDIGTDQSIPIDTWTAVEVKIVTGTGSASLSWRVNGTTVATTGSLTIANVDDLDFVHPYVLSGSSSIWLRVDDHLTIKSSDWPGTTYVNQRVASSSTPTYDAWGKTCVGGTNAGALCSAASECPSGACGTAATVWSSPTGSLNGTFPDGTSDPPYARSPDTTDTGQTLKFNAWDSGTPTPVINSATATALWGCRWDSVAGRGTGTNRAYALRRYIPGICIGGTNTAAACTVASQCPSGACQNEDTTQSYTASTYVTTQMLFEIPGSSVATKITHLNAMELGGLKTNASSGARMYLDDQWLQCAWSAAAAASRTYMMVLE